MQTPAEASSQPLVHAVGRVAVGGCMWLVVGCKGAIPGGGLVWLLVPGEGMFPYPCVGTFASFGVGRNCLPVSPGCFGGLGRVGGCLGCQDCCIELLLHGMAYEGKAMAGGRHRHECAAWLDGWRLPD